MEYVDEAFRLSNTLTADFCVEALQEAMARFGAPEIFNTDQGAHAYGRGTEATTA